MKAILTIVGVVAVAAAAATVVELRRTPEPAIGRVQTDLPRLVRFCPGLGEPTSAHWRYYPLGAPSWQAPGPTDNAIEALVTLSPDHAAALRQRSPWTPAQPSISDQLAPHASEGMWRSGSGDPCPGYHGPVYLQDGTTLLYFKLSQQ